MSYFATTIRIKSPVLLVLISFSLFILILPVISEAKSVTLPSRMLSWEQSGSCGGGGGSPDCPYVSYIGTVEYQLYAYVSGTSALISEGSTVPTGTSVEFRPNFYSTQLSWFQQGGSFDSPNGSWISSLSAITGTNYGWIHEIPVMTYDHSGSTAGLSCSVDGSICTVTSAGVIQTTATYNVAPWTFSYIDTGLGITFITNVMGPMTVGLLTPTSPETSITYPINVSAPSNLPPAPPTITGPTTGSVNVPQPLTFIATDPENDQLKYGLSDSTCTSVLQWVPGSGFVTSGTSQTNNQTWGSAGVYTIYVFSQDSQGARSSTCTPHQITISSVPVATASLTVNGTVGPINVSKNTTINLAWVSANAASCTKWGGVWGSGQGIALSGTDTTVVSATSIYMVNCGGVVSSVQVNVVNQTPNPPTVTHPTGNAAYNTDTIFTITGTDSDGDAVFYEIDWDNDGAVDATTMSVPSGTSQLATYSWSDVGAKTFQARTVDSGGVSSAWTPHTITISNPPPATATIEVSVNGNPFVATDPTVNPNDTITIGWSSTNATTCSSTGSGFVVTATSGSDVVTTPVAATSETYTVTCSGAGGFGSDTVTITTRQNPDLSTPLIGRTPSAGFTTTYDSLAIYFQTGNIGGSDITVNAAYTLEYDSNNDGSYDTTRTGTLGTLAVGQYVTRTETFTNVPFGTIKARVTVDYTDVITEVNETDNVGTLNDTLPPPDPGLTFTSDRIQVRHNEKANLNWSLSTPYSGITCQVYGPNININPVTVPSSVETAAIPAKSEFTFKCTEGVSGTTWIKTIWVETVGEIEEI